MVTSAECRTLVLVSSEEASHEHNMATRAILINMARSWVSLANQTDRLSTHRAVAEHPQAQPARHYLKLVPTLWPLRDGRLLAIDQADNMRCLREAGLAPLPLI